MPRISKTGYLERRTTGNKGSVRQEKGNFRNWWLVQDIIQLGNLSVPERYEGKRLRFKVEVVKE